MKRFIAMCLAALMIVSASVVAGAAAADWTPGNGAHIVSKEGEIISENTPVTVTDGADGTVVVKHGGYYQTGENWAGVASNGLYNINGLEVTVKFDVIPEVTAEDDCWICFDLLKEPFMFYTNPTSKNPGFMNLIRFGRAYIEVYEGVEAFSQVYNSQTDNPGFFTLKSGDVVTAKWEYITEPVIGYKCTFTINEENVFELPYVAENLVDCFPDGKAHVVLNCNLKGSEKDAFTYTIVNIKDGVEKTQEEIDAVAAIRAENERAAKAEEASKYITDAEERINKAIGNVDESGVEEAVAKLQEGKDALAAAKAAVEAGAFDEVEGYCDTAKDAAKDAEKLVREANRAAGLPADGAQTNNEATTGAEVEEGSSNIGLIIAIIVIAIVVIAAVVVVVLKKKKN